MTNKTKTICSNCGSTNVEYLGSNERGDGYRCSSCGYSWGPQDAYQKRCAPVIITLISAHHVLVTVSALVSSITC